MPIVPLWNIDDCRVCLHSSYLYQSFSSLLTQGVKVVSHLRPSFSGLVRAHVRNRLAQYVTSALFARAWRLTVSDAPSCEYECHGWDRGYRHCMVDCSHPCCAWELKLSFRTCISFLLLTYLLTYYCVSNCWQCEIFLKRPNVLQHNISTPHFCPSPFNPAMSVPTIPSMTFIFTTRNTPGVLSRIFMQFLRVKMRCDAITKDTVVVWYTRWWSTCVL